MHLVLRFILRLKLGLRIFCILLLAKLVNNKYLSYILKLRICPYIDISAILEFLRHEISEI